MAEKTTPEEAAAVGAAEDSMELTGDVGYSTGSFSVRDDQPIAQVPSIAHDASQYIDEVSTTTHLDPTSTAMY